MTEHGSIQSAAPTLAVSGARDRRRGARWALLCLGLFAIGFGTHMVALRVTEGTQGSALVDAVRPAANMVQMTMIPGWVAARVLARLFAPSSMWSAVWANAVGAGAWTVAAWTYGRIRDRLGRPGPDPLRVANPARRRLLLDVPTAAVGLVGGAALARSALTEPWDLRVVRYQVPIRGLPSSLDGLRLVQVSDTHLGPRIPASHVVRAVRLALDLRPDVFLLTGDYIHNGVRFARDAAALFEPLVETGRPVVSVLGNHDWYGAGELLLVELAGRGITNLDNGRRYLDAGTRRLTMTPGAGGSLCLAGVGDLREHIVDLEAALEGVPGDVPRLLLAHNPDTAEVAGLQPGGRTPPPRVDLMVCGHTHGGQVRLPLLGTPIIPSAFGQKYAGGLVEGPSCRVLISRGVGMSILPVRWGVPPEVVELTLVRAS